jgi:hypothetical protein
MSTKTILVNITLGPSAAKAAATTLAKLDSAGLRDATLLEALGIVTGCIEEKKLGALAKVAGVTVEKSEEVHIPPPDAPIQ